MSPDEFAQTFEAHPQGDGARRRRAGRARRRRPRRTARERARAHRGRPGLGKTLVARALGSRVAGARSSASSSRRTSCRATSPAPPSSIARRGAFNFIAGPDLLPDPARRRDQPRTREDAVVPARGDAGSTGDGRRHVAPSAQPFVVVATQNPVESQGTYPLPEAQLDRFLVKLTVADPPVRSSDDDRAPPRRRASTRPTSPAFERRDPEEHSRDAGDARRACASKTSIVSYIVDLVRRTRDDRAIELGALSSSVDRPAQVRAGHAPRAQGRDVRHTRRRQADGDAAVLRHRVMLHPDAQLQGVTPDERVDDILKAAPVPRVAA